MTANHPTVRKRVDNKVGTAFPRFLCMVVLVAAAAKPGVRLARLKRLLTDHVALAGGVIQLSLLKFLFFPCAAEVH